MRMPLSRVRAVPLSSMTLTSVACLCVLPPRAARAQGADAPRVVTPALDFSGVIYGNFRYTYDDATKNANGGNATQHLNLPMRC